MCDRVRILLKMSLRPALGATSAHANIGRLQKVLEIGAHHHHHKIKPYRLASVNVSFGKTVYVDVVIPQLGSNVIIVRDDLTPSDRARLSDILNRVAAGERLSTEELAFLYTLD